MSPVSLQDLPGVLDQDLSAAKKTGELAPWTPTGIAVGIYSHGQTLVLTYGTAKRDSMFEIGSTTKTFTDLILAQMVQQGVVRLDEPLRELLPPGTVARPISGPEITLLDLGEHRSGLPRDADQASAESGSSITSRDGLYTWLKARGVAKGSSSRFEYSNIGLDLLGEALAARAGVPYETLLHEEITGPLGMRDTTTQLTPALRARLLPGHNGAHFPARARPDNALPGAGGVRSTAEDLLRYTEAELHPEQVVNTLTNPDRARTLSAAIRATQVLRADAFAGTRVGLGWFQLKNGELWHGGATEGYSSDVRFDLEGDYAIVVLCNVYEDNFFFTRRLGEHIGERLTGRAAASLDPSVILPTERKEVPIDATETPKFARTFELADGSSVRLEAQGNTLQGTMHGLFFQLAYLGLQEGHPSFFLRELNGVLEFVPGDNGQFNSFIFHRGGVDDVAKRR